MKIELKRIRINEFIRVPQVRLIDETGEQLGVKPTHEALKIAREKGLDLIEIAPQSVPPVCKITEYSKYKYELKRRHREQRKKQKLFQLKEIRFSPRIGDHDIEYKINHVREFIDKKNKVKITIFFRGREMMHADLGMELMKKIKERVADIAIFDSEPKIEGHRIVAILSPAKK